MSRRALSWPSPTSSVARRISRIGRTNPRARTALEIAASRSAADPTPTRLRRARSSIARSRAIEEPARSSTSPKRITDRSSRAEPPPAGAAKESWQPVSRDHAASVSGSNSTAAISEPSARPRVASGTRITAYTAPPAGTRVASGAFAWVEQAEKRSPAAAPGRTHGSPSPARGPRTRECPAGGGSDRTLTGLGRARAVPAHEHDGGRTLAAQQCTRVVAQRRRLAGLEVRAELRSAGNRCVVHGLLPQVVREEPLRAGGGALEARHRGALEVLPQCAVLERQSDSDRASGERHHERPSAAPRRRHAGGSRGDLRRIEPNRLERGECRVPRARSARPRRWRRSRSRARSRPGGRCRCGRRRGDRAARNVARARRTHPSSRPGAASSRSGSTRARRTSPALTRHAPERRPRDASPGGPRTADGRPRCDWRSAALHRG